MEIPDRPLVLEGLAVFELHVWSESEKRARQQTGRGSGPDALELLGWELSALARITEALNVFLLKRETGGYGWWTRTWESLCRLGPDVEGLVMLSAWLAQQVEHWRGLASVAGPRREEAAARGALHARASALFHARLGADPATVASYAPFLNLDEACSLRSGLPMRWDALGVPRVEEPEGPPTETERAARLAETVARNKGAQR